MKYLQIVKCKKTKSIYDLVNCSGLHYKASSDASRHKGWSPMHAFNTLHTMDTLATMDTLDTMDTLITYQ